MMNIISKEDIIKEKINSVKEGELVENLFKIAEELGIGDEIEIQNTFSFKALDFIADALKEKVMIKADDIYIAIRNVYYIVELYLRGYYNKEHYIGYEEFLNLVMSGRSKEIILASQESFHLHINRLKKIILKSKKKIPRGNKIFNNTRSFLVKLDSDLTVCKKCLTKAEKLSEFPFGGYYGLCAPVMVDNLNGFLKLEETVYSIYNELRILAKIDLKYITKVYMSYIKIVGMEIPFNLFEKVINNYLFAIPYSDTPEDLSISKVDADLLIKEIKLGTVTAKELTDKLIERYEFKDFTKEYLEEYGKYIQKRLEDFKISNYFSELFLVIPPD